MDGLARAFLFVPGNRPERFGKALAAGADAVIVDLEDAVAPGDKDAARAAVAAWLSVEHPVVLRINGADTAWFADDLALCAHDGVCGVMLPKAGRVDDLAAVSAAMAGRAEPAALLPLIETAAGFDALRAVAAAPGVQRLVFGSIDFQLDLGILGDGEELLYFRSQLVLASRLANLAAPVDGVSTSFDDLAALEHDTQHAMRLGFGAKLCIHPRQVDTVRRVFSPSESDVAWARRVMDAATASNGAAVALDGKMVDRPVIERARGILRRVV
jgi:citrate lyase subunit beta/citryl-CoA lyase